MSSRPRDKYRKFESGSQKREKKQKVERYIKKQHGALDKFIIPSLNNPEHILEAQNINFGDLEQPCCSKELLQNNIATTIEQCDVIEKDNELITKELVHNNHETTVGQDDEIINKTKLNFDFNDPADWPDILTDDLRIKIITNKSDQIQYYEYYPKNEQNRKFSKKLYYRQMDNGLKIERNWLVYSKSYDKVYCFCCKLYNNQMRIPNPGSLTNIGTSDWKHLAEKLQQHETSSFHRQSVLSWIELKTRIVKN